MRKLLLVIFLVMGCAKVTHHNLPDVPYSPIPPEGAYANPRPIIYEQWWEQTEKCSHLKGNLKKVKFFLVPEDVPLGFTYRGDILLGLWIWPHYIFIAQTHEYDSLVVRHEMLHSLLGKGGHPKEYFCGLCKGVVIADCLYYVPPNLNDKIVPPEAERW